MESSIYPPLPQGNLWPAIKPKSLGAAEFDGLFNNSLRLEGFVGDGDYIQLPANGTDDLEYFNAAGASQWTVDSQTDINVSIDDWCGFMFDDTASLLYMVSVNEGLTPSRYYLTSVNVSGTVVNIGDDAPTGDFTTGTGVWFNSAATGPVCNIYRTADGSGNIFMRRAESAGMEEMEINITTGAIASDPALVVTGLDGLYKTANGNYSGLVRSIADPGIMNMEVGSAAPEFGGPVALNGALGAIVPALGIVMQWKGYLAFTNTAAATTFHGARFWDVTIYEYWIDSIVDIMRGLR